MSTIATIAGPIELAVNPEPSRWSVHTVVDEVAPGVQVLRVRLNAAEPASLPELRFDWRFSLAAVRGRWKIGRASCRERV